MKERLEKRLAELQQEFTRGEQMLADVQKQELALKESMLRISGAIQVLQEELQSLGEPSEHPENAVAME